MRHTTFKSPIILWATTKEWPPLRPFRGWVFSVIPQSQEASGSLPCFLPFPANPGEEQGSLYSLLSHHWDIDTVSCSHSGKGHPSGHQGWSSLLEAGNSGSYSSSCKGEGRKGFGLHRKRQVNTLLTCPDIHSGILKLLSRAKKAVFARPLLPPGGHCAHKPQPYIPSSTCSCPPQWPPQW